MTVDARPVPLHHNRLWWEISDALTIARRNLQVIPRNPELLVDVTVQPILFVLLFRFVFGGAIQVPGGSYVNFLMAGIFVQTSVFGALSTGIGLADDLKKGLVDRFRSLPMGRSSVMTGRTISDLVRSLLAIALMLIVGVLVGFQPAGSIVAWTAGIALLLLFSLSISWIAVVVALSIRSSEAVNAVMFIVVFPLTFASSAFVPTTGMPDWLRPFAENQPISLLVNTLRALTLGTDPGTAPLGVIAWSLVVLLITVPLGVRLYRRSAGG